MNNWIMSATRDISTALISKEHAYWIVLYYEILDYFRLRRIFTFHSVILVLGYIISSNLCSWLNHGYTLKIVTYIVSTDSTPSCMNQNYSRPRAMTYYVLYYDSMMRFFSSYCYITFYIMSNLIFFNYCIRLLNNQYSLHKILIDFI